jgi:hypothetical protein
MIIARSCRRLLCLAIVLLPWLGGVAAAQDTPRVTSPPASAPATSQMTLEPMDNGWAIAPDARITEVDGRTSALVGGYAGWMTDRTLLVGAGGYWLADGANGAELAYGGLVVEWLARSDQRIGFGVRGLVGGGGATLKTTFRDFFGRDVDIARLPGRGHGFRDGRVGNPDDLHILVREYFFVAEPTAQIVWHITRWMRVDLGAGYRLTSGAGPLDERLRGASGSLAIQFGGTSRRAQP